MPQEIRILQCFQCETFQTDIVKRVNKWSCKICGVKQSVKKEFYRGKGSEARTKVQQFNIARGNRTENELQKLVEDTDDNCQSINNNNRTEQQQQNSNEVTRESKSSKWERFVGEDVATSKDSASFMNSSNAQKRGSAGKRKSSSSDVEQNKCSKWSNFC